MNDITEHTDRNCSTVCDALLQRAPELEAWHGIVLDHLSADYDRPEQTLTVFCEIRPETGPELKHNIELNAVLYDGNGRIMAQETVLFRKSNFYGFDIVSITFNEITPKQRPLLGKIRIYPSKW